MIGKVLACIHVLLAMRTSCGSDAHNLRRRMQIQWLEGRIKQKQQEIAICRQQVKQEKDELSLLVQQLKETAVTPDVVCEEHDERFKEMLADLKPFDADKDCAWNSEEAKAATDSFPDEGDKLDFQKLCISVDSDQDDKCSWQEIKLYLQKFYAPNPENE